MHVKISARMSGKEWGDYPIIPEQIRVSRMTDGGVLVEIKPRVGGLTEGGRLVLSHDVAMPFSRAMQNILEGLQGETLDFPATEERPVTD